MISPSGLDLIIFSYAFFFSFQEFHFLSFSWFSRQPNSCSCGVSIRGFSIDCGVFDLIMLNFCRVNENVKLRILMTSKHVKKRSSHLTCETNGFKSESKTCSITQLPVSFKSGSMAISIHKTHSRTQYSALIVFLSKAPL